MIIIIIPWNNLDIALGGGLAFSVTFPPDNSAACVCCGLGGGHLEHTYLDGHLAGPGGGF